MVSVNQSELCISMYFYFHFIPRINRLVANCFFFKDLNATLISLLKRGERAGRRKKGR